MADPQFLRQKSPGPTCVAVNVFSGRVIAMATNAVEDDAMTTAKGLAEGKRRTLANQDRDRTCPANCPQPGGNSSSIRPYGDALSSVCADADTPIYVAYYWTGWRVSVPCASTPQYADLAIATDTVMLEHTVDTVCPGTRTMSGCVLAMAIDTSQSDADDKASGKAKEVADATITTQRKIACPGGCARQLGGDTVSTPVKLGPHHEIMQARAGGAVNGAKRFVSYYAATWSVEIRCVQEDGGDDGDDGGEGEMHTPRRGSGQR